MGDIKLNLGGGVNQALALTHPSANANSVEDESKKKIARDFEGVLLNKVMEEMRNSVPESGLLEDESSKQTQSLFWMYLSQDVANKGGLGLWKQIYEQMNGMPGQKAAPEIMDSTL